MRQGQEACNGSTWCIEMASRKLPCKKWWSAAEFTMEFMKARTHLMANGMECTLQSTYALVSLDRYAIFLVCSRKGLLPVS